MAFCLHGLSKQDITSIFYLHSRNDISCLKIMEVVSILNLVYLEIKKTTTACHFQTMVMNVFVMPYDLMRDQIGSYTYMQI